MILPIRFVVHFLSFLLSSGLLLPNPRLGIRIPKNLINTNEVRKSAKTMGIYSISEAISTDGGLKMESKNLSEHNAWVPIISLSNADPKFPISIIALGKRLVVWKSTDNKWSVMSDVCPHRLAPLSEGRVDPVSGCIECPYHGWQFDKSGECTKIPQLDKNRVDIPKGTQSTSFPVHVMGDLLWALLPLPPGQASSYPTLPEDIEPAVSTAPSFISRDLPYSFDFVVENFMDPAHIPFAHHKLQGSRADARSILINQTTSVEDPMKFSIEYDDTTGGRNRTAVTTFIPPCYFTLRSVSPKDNVIDKTIPKELMLLILIVPVEPGKSRLFLSLRPNKKLLPVPRWLVHSFANKFLDSDLWLHDQERNVRNTWDPYGESTQVSEEKKYVMPTSSDKGCRSWRAWWMKHMANSIIFGLPPAGALKWLALDEQRDRYESHIKNCKHCTKALKDAARLKSWSPIAAMLFFALGKSWLQKIVGLAVFGLMNIVSEWMVKTISGPNKSSRISAAQL